MHTIENIWIAIVKGYEFLNHNGFPVPVIIGIMVLMLFGKAQANWSSRERYYCDLVKNLGIWQQSLLGRLEFYEDGNGEYFEDTYVQSIGYKSHEENGTNAYKSIRDLMDVASIYLSESSNSNLQKLIGDHWFISNHGACNQEEYLNSMYKVVHMTYQNILKEARTDLNKSKFSTLWQNAQKTIKG